jgi:DNA-binding SARP family transcriptional activator/tetratricopeptide (TPR) repeat protein
MVVGVEVLLLGPLVVCADAGALAVGAQKERALLAALALRSGQVLSVGELVDVLWGAAPPPTAVKTLQAYVSKLRRVLGPGVVATERPGYVLRLPADSVDVARTYALAEHARHTAAHGDPVGAIEAFREALALWRGDPLPDLASSELGRTEIARLRELRHSMIEDLLEAMLAAGQHHLALPDLEARVLEEPLRERGWELLMLALYRAGRQVDALRAFQLVRSILGRQIGVEPGTSLRELEAAIIAHDPRLALEEPAASMTLAGVPASARSPAAEVGSAVVEGAGRSSRRDGDAPKDPAPAPHALPSSLSWFVSTVFPFAGRDGELAAIRAGWDECVAHRRRGAVLVGGEPGIGKTRLIGELATVLQAQGAIVLFGRCEDGMGAPYQPFVEAFTAFVDACPPAMLHELLGPLAGELTRLLPHLRSIGPEIGAPVAAEADTERHRLFEAISETLERISERQPVLLVLDDLQWATTPTLLLLQHVLTTSRPARLLIAGTYRTTELDRVYPLAAMLADLRRHENVRRLTLDGLDERAAIAMASLAADHDLDDGGTELIRRLHRECAGNPFFFWTMLTHLVETGLIVRRDGRWTHTEAAFATPLPEGVREVVARRLSSLDDSTSALLRVAALLGNGFDYRVVADVAGTDDDHVLDALDLARHAGVVMDVRGTYGRYMFGHDLLRRSLVEELSTTRRARMHWRITEVLIERYGDRVRHHLDEIARHAVEGALAGDLHRAADITRMAGDAALDALAFEEAAAYYDEALGFVDAEQEGQLPGTAGDEADRILDRRFQLLLAKGRALQRAGHADHRDVLDEAAATARRRHDPDQLAEAVLAMHHTAYLNISAATDPGLRARFQEALDGLDDRDRARDRAAAEPVDETDTKALGVRARLSSALALTLSLSDRRDRAIVLSTDAVRLARLSNDPRVLAQVLSDHSWVITGPDTVTERVALGEEAVALARDLGDHVGLINGYNCLTTAWFEIGELDKGLASLRSGLELAEFLRRPTVTWGFNVHLGALAMWQADVPTLEARADELLAMGHEAGVDPATLLAVYARLLFAARFEQGRLHEFEGLLAALAEQPSDVDWGVVLGIVYVETGRLDEARAILERVRHGPRNRDLTWVPLRMLATLVVAGVSDERLAAALYADLLPFAGRNSHDGAGTCGPIDLGLGRLATVLHRWEDASRHFEGAAARCRAWNAPMWSAHVALEHAQLLLRQAPADTAVARRLLASCVGTARTTGQQRVMDRATALLADVP